MMRSGFPGVEIVEGKYPALVSIAERFNRQSEQETMHPVTSHPWTEPNTEDTWLRAKTKVSLYNTPYWELAKEEEIRQLGIYEMATWWQAFLVFEHFVTEYYMKLISDGTFAGFPTVVEYMHHFCREEINHSMCFEKAMAHFNVDPFIRTESMNFDDTYVKNPPGKYPLINVFLTFMVEWVADQYQRNDITNPDGTWAEEVHPISVAIVKEHSREEARHIAWGKEMIKSLADEVPGFMGELQAFTPNFLRGFVDSGVTNIEGFQRIQFHHPAFKDEEKLIETVINSEYRKGLHLEMLKPVFKFFLKSGIYDRKHHDLWVNAGWAASLDAAFETVGEPR